MFVPLFWRHVRLQAGETIVLCGLLVTGIICPGSLLWQSRSRWVCLVCLMLSFPATQTTHTNHLVSPSPGLQQTLATFAGVGQVIFTVTQHIVKPIASLLPTSQAKVSHGRYDRFVWQHRCCLYLICSVSLMRPTLYC